MPRIAYLEAQVVKKGIHAHWHTNTSKIEIVAIFVKKKGTYPDSAQDLEEAMMKKSGKKKQERTDFEHHHKRRNGLNHRKQQFEVLYNKKSKVQGREDLQNFKGNSS